MNNALKKIWQFWWVGLLIIIAPCLIQMKIPDSDTFFLAATGRYIVENGVVPAINPFVIHEGFKIIVQQWLFDVLIYMIYTAGGNAGLFAFILTTYIISLILMYKYFSLFTNNAKHKGIIMFLAGFLYITYSVPRPTSITFIVFISLLYCLEKYRRTNKNKYLFVLPILALIEINIHAAMWPMMFVVMLPYIFPYTLPRKNTIKSNIKKWFNKNKFILLTIALMFLVGFLNPYGIEGMTYVIKSYGSATGGIPINELTSPTVNSFFGILIILTCVSICLYVYQNRYKLFLSKEDNQTIFTRIYMSLGVVFLASMHIRSMWYLIIGATPVILEVLNNCKWNIKKKKKDNETKNLFLKTYIYLFIVIILGISMFSTTSFSESTNQDSSTAPIAATKYLEQINKNDVVLYTEFNNGAFMEWNGYKVYMDARPELFQEKINGKENVYTEYSNLILGDIDYQQFLDKYNFTHLIVLEKSIFNMYLQNHQDYKPVIDGNGYTLYAYNK